MFQLPSNSTQLITDEDNPYWWILASLSTILFILSISTIVIRNCVLTQSIASTKIVVKEKQLKPPICVPQTNKIVHIKPPTNIEMQFLKKGVSRQQYLSR